MTWPAWPTPTFMRKVLAFVLRRMTISSETILIWLLSILKTLKSLTTPGQTLDGTAMESNCWGPGVEQCLGKSFFKCLMKL